MRALYLSGAPRLSTKATTESLGPRSHILGVIGALRHHGIDVDQLIVGDSVPELVHGEGSEERMSSSRSRVLMTDIGRLTYRLRSRLMVLLKTRRQKYDVVYERYALFQELGSVARFVTGSLWILEVNALLSIESTSDRRTTSSRRLAIRMERRTLKRADLIVAVTEALALQISEVHRIPASKIMVVQNGVDHREHERLAEGSMAGLTRSGVSDVLTVGFVGTLYSWQSVNKLIELLAETEFERVALRVAGDGPEHAALMAQVKRLGLEDRVVLEGRVHPDEVAHFLSEVDFCYSGHSSANGSYFSPLKLWEYLAAGKPVVASAHEATLSLVEEGYPIVCFGFDGISLRDALREALADRYDLQRRAAELQERVWRDHSWAQRIEPVIERLKASA